MAGKPNRSGGARKNAGGARPGAGRPKKAAVASSIAATPVDDDTTAQKAAETFLLAVMNDLRTDQKLRIDAAKTLYKGEKVPEIGKKAQRAGAAKSAGGGKFAPAAPPKLVVNNR